MTAIRRFAFGFMFVTCVALLTSRVSANQTMISDFEKGLSGWVFTNGPEFPGAQGSLTQATDQNGAWGRISCDLSKGGNYVGAVLATPGLNADGLSVWLKTPITTKVRIRINDASGQTLQYDVLRTLEGSLDPSNWYSVVVNLAAPDTYYGGANDGKPHTPIASIGVLAVPEFGTTGSVEFDELSAVTGPLDLALNPESAPLLPAPSGAAALSPRLAVNLHTTGNSRALDLARDAGFSVVRLDLLWVHSELTPGVYNFQEFDGFVDSLAARGMRLHLILDYTNPLYPDVTDPDFSTVTIPAFAALAQATAQHFAGKNLTYEIWNEPNSSTFWPQEAGAKLFADLCNAAIKAVHAGDPDALVTTGGTSGVDFSFIQTLVSSGGVDSADAIGVHPYRKGGGETVGHDLALLHGMISSTLPDAPPIWDTEWGYSSAWDGDGHGATERGRQAQLVTRELLSAWAIGLPLVVYYDLNDGGSNATSSDENFGLLTTDNSDKPAIVGVRTLSNAAKTRRYTGLLQTEVGSLHALRLDGSNDTTLVLWTDDVSRDTVVHLPRNATATDYLGNPITLTTSTNTADLTLNEAAGPVYVTFAGASNAGGGSDASGGANNATGGMSAAAGSAPTLTSSGGAATGGTNRGGASSATGGTHRGGGSSTSGTNRGGASDATGGVPSTGGTGSSGSRDTSSTGGATRISSVRSGGAPSEASSLENSADTSNPSCSCSMVPDRKPNLAWVWAVSALSLVFIRRQTRGSKHLHQAAIGFHRDGIAIPQILQVLRN